MKKNIVFLIIVSSLIIGCWEDGPSSSSNDAFLEIQNLLDELVFFRLQDGEFGDYPVMSLQPDETYIKSWDHYDDLFLENAGEVVLEYWKADSLEVTSVNFEMEPYNTYYYDIGSGTPDLMISNDTNSLTWFSIDSADNIMLEADEDYRLFFQDIVPNQITLEYNGYHVFSGQTELVLNQFLTDFYDIDATGGAVKIINNSTQTDITEVYIAMSEDEFGGEEVLDGILEHEDSAIWTVTSGNWDVLLVDNWGNEIVHLNNYVQLDNTVTISFRSIESPAASFVRRKGKAVFGKVEKN
jgi:hypothetical protein